MSQFDVFFRTAIETTLDCFLFHQERIVHVSHVSRVSPANTLKNKK
jgi:hypothetical protein